MVFVFGSAVAVIIDATIVRCLLVPALMILTGKHNWYIPHWLDKLVPHISIEGAEYFYQQDQQQPPQPQPQTHQLAKCCTP